MRNRVTGWMLAGLILLCALPVGATAETLRFEAAHTSATFAYDHFGLTRPTAKIMGASGVVVLDRDQPANSSVDVRLDMATLSTGLAEFDTLLKGEDYFDVARFPAAIFVSRKVEVTGETTARVTGDLTIRDVTQAIVLDVTLTVKAFNPALFKTGTGFTATATLSRKAFGLNRYAGFIGDTIDLHIQAEAY